MNHNRLRTTSDLNQRKIAFNDPVKSRYLNLMPQQQKVVDKMLGKQGLSIGALTPNQEFVMPHTRSNGQSVDLFVRTRRNGNSSQAKGDFAPAKVARVRQHKNNEKVGKWLAGSALVAGLIGSAVFGNQAQEAPKQQPHVVFEAPKKATQHTETAQQPQIIFDAATAFGAEAAKSVAKTVGSASQEVGNKIAEQSKAMLESVTSQSAGKQGEKPQQGKDAYNHKEADNFGVSELSIKAAVGEYNEVQQAYERAKAWVDHQAEAEVAKTGFKAERTFLPYDKYAKLYEQEKAKGSDLNRFIPADFMPGDTELDVDSNNQPASRTAMIYNYLLDSDDLKLNRLAVAGIVANLAHESGVSPTSVEKATGEGLGLAQWSFGRRHRLVSFAQQLGLPATDTLVQLKFLEHELLTTYKPVLEAVRKAETVEKATREFHDGFERSNDDEKRLKSREDKAKYLLQSNGVTYAPPHQ